MKYFYLLVLSLLVLLPVCVSAQADVHYSQFYEMTILRNPALAGVFANNYKVSVAYRDQWSSITYPFQTLQINAEYRLSMGRNSNDYITAGVHCYNDKAGDLDQKITGM